MKPYKILCDETFMNNLLNKLTLAENKLSYFFNANVRLYTTISNFK